jgi:hypothetical protein
VIEDVDVDQSQGFAQSRRDELVGVAGFCDSAARMVVRQDHGGGVVLTRADLDLKRQALMQVFPDAPRPPRGEARSAWGVLT